MFGETFQSKAKAKQKGDIYQTTLLLLIDHTIITEYIIHQDIHYYTQIYYTNLPKANIMSSY